MANTFANVYSNLNHVDMAGLMIVPMVAIGLLAMMRGMYHNKTRNAVMGGVIAGIPFSCSSENRPPRRIGNF